MKKWLALGFGVLVFACGIAGTQEPAPASAAASLKIDGAIGTPLTLTIEDLKKMPRKTLTVANPHDKKTEVYEGVLVEELLKKAGVDQMPPGSAPSISCQMLLLEALNLPMLSRFTT